jgi:hypothetical protein
MLEEHRVLAGQAAAAQLAACQVMVRLAQRILDRAVVAAAPVLYHRT